MVRLWKSPARPSEQTSKRPKLYPVFARVPRQTAVGTEVRNPERHRLTKDHGREVMSEPLARRLESS